MFVNPRERTGEMDGKMKEEGGYSLFYAGRKDPAKMRCPRALTGNQAALALRAPASRSCRN